jgi:hypothetical protein
MKRSKWSKIVEDGHFMLAILLVFFHNFLSKSCMDNTKGNINNIVTHYFGNIVQ